MKWKTWPPRTVLRTRKHDVCYELMMGIVVQNMAGVL